MKKTIRVFVRAMLCSLLKLSLRIKYCFFGYSKRGRESTTSGSSQIQLAAAESKRIRQKLLETEQLLAAGKTQSQSSSTHDESQRQKILKGESGTGDSFYELIAASILFAYLKSQPD